MAVVKNLPRYVERNDPSVQWLTDIQAELGFTMPKLNGTDLMGTADLRPGGSGKPHLDARLMLPTFQTARTDHTSEDDDKAWTATVSAEAHNAFDWEITVPKRGPWTNDMARGHDVAMVAIQVQKEMSMRGELLSPAIAGKIAQILPGETWSLQVTAHGGFDQLITHTYIHENQHYSDHCLIIDTILGRWDQYLRVGTSLQSDMKPSAEGALGRGTGWNPRDRTQPYTPVPASIVGNLYHEFVESGKTYHKSATGGPCLRRIVAIDFTPKRVLTIEAEARPVLLGTHTTVPPPLWNAVPFLGKPLR